MDVRPGYKQTQVGFIPVDWNHRPFGYLYAEPSRNGIYKTAEFQGRGTRIVNMGEMFGFEFIADQDMSRVALTARELSVSGLQDGDLLFGRRSVVPSGAGKCSLVVSPTEPLTFESSIIRVRLDKAVAYPLFYYYFFGSAMGRSIVGTIVSGTNVKGIRATELRDLPVPLPNKAEQEAIAAALSDMDALLAKLDHLIAKKRDLKEATVQELLCEKPGDDVRLLREVSSLKGRIGWQGLKQAEFTNNEDEPFLITGMNFKNGAIRWHEVYHIPETRYEMAPEIQLKPEDVLMTKDGTIGKVLYIDTIPHPGKASLNSHLLLFRPAKDSYSPKYLYYQLASRRFQDYIELSKSGTTFFGLSQAAVGSYPVLLPPMPEQIRIATILSDMDAEIAALEARRNKTRALKQGMMQELLTGRIRLV
ncbi:MAG: restriction endonuclease subunit S [Chloroflexota bacterium]